MNKKVRKAHTYTLQELIAHPSVLVRTRAFQILNVLETEVLCEAYGVKRLPEVIRQMGDVEVPLPVSPS